MKTQLIIGNVKSTLLKVLANIEEVYTQLSDSGLYTEHVSSTVLDRLATDIEGTRNAYRHYCTRQDSGTEHNLYNNINILSDRLILIQRRVANVLHKDSEVVESLKSLVELIISVRGQFIFDTRGRDTTNDVIDKDGKGHRRNMHIKLEHQRILDAGRLSELD